MYILAELRSHLIACCELRPTKIYSGKTFWGLLAHGANKEQSSIWCVLLLFLNSFQTMGLFMSCALADDFYPPVLGKRWERIENKRLCMAMHVPGPAEDTRSRCTSCGEAVPEARGRVARSHLGERCTWRCRAARGMFRTVISVLKTFSGLWSLAFEGVVILFYFFVGRR